MIKSIFNRGSDLLLAASVLIITTKNAYADGWSDIAESGSDEATESANYAIPVIFAIVGICITAWSLTKLSKGGDRNEGKLPLIGAAVVGVLLTVLGGVIYATQQSLGLDSEQSVKIEGW